MDNQLADTVRFYELLDCLTERLGGARILRECNGRMNWPERGVYFFFENGESRLKTGNGQRVVRVGTHGLRRGAKNKLWNRLAQHRGPANGIGNHRGSIFRLIVGAALGRRGDVELPESWGVGSDLSQAARKLGIGRDEIKELENPIEAIVSEYIGGMPFLWLEVDDAPGPDSKRGFIERNAIALLSGHNHSEFDEPSTEWLGRYSDRELVRLSGLWNNRHVDEDYAPIFLDDMERWIDAMHG